MRHGILCIAQPQGAIEITWSKHGAQWAKLYTICSEITCPTLRINLYISRLGA